MSIFKTIKIIVASMVIVISSTHYCDCAEFFWRQRQAALFQQADELAQKSIDAAKQGDLKTSQQYLNQIDNLIPFPRFQAIIQSNSRVQEAKKAHVEAEQAAIRVATQAAAEKAEEEKLILEREKQQEIANRIAYEKEQAQKQIAQMQEDKKKATLKQKQKSHPHSQQQQLSHSPQAMTHQEGKSFTSSFIGDVKSAAQSTNPIHIPGFQSDKPKEASLDVETIGDAALVESRSHEVSKHLMSSTQERPKFKIDPATDPLFKNAKEAIHDPQKSLTESIQAISNSDEVTEVIKTCDEGGDEYQQACSKRLAIKLKITPESSSTTYVCGGHKERRGLHYSHWTCAGCVPRTVTIPKKVEVVSEQWIDGCAVLEDRVENGLCRYVSKTTSPQNETRTIEGEPIARDHFEEHYTYACFEPSQNTCAGLREQGCYQIKSVCKEKMGDHSQTSRCVLWQQTYSCPSGKKSLNSYKSSNRDNPFCLTGDCADTSYEANGELFNVMSHLYTLREAQNDLKNLGIIFKGQTRWCTRNCLDFRDCCGSAGGWGVTLHLSSCDKAEIELRTLRDKNLCVQVGTYCAERDKVFNSCLRKKTTFCCYGTKLARLIQQSGRAQLGINWGTSEHPTCERGFSLDELSRIDFSQINFSEIFEDIKEKLTLKDQGQSLAEVSSKRLQNNMTLLTKPVQNSSDQQKQRVLKDKGL